MMTAHTSSVPSRPLHRPGAVALSAPLHWLSLGIQDFRRAPGVGVAYGLVVTVLGWLILALGDHPYFVAAAVSGFLLIGPVLGAGLIESSRVMAAGETPSFDSSLRGLQDSLGDLGRFAVALLVIAAAWLVLSTTLLVLAVGPIAPGVEQALWDSALRSMSVGQFLAWAAIGGVLALISFCVSIITVPLILDTRASASDAMRDSLRVVVRHPGACAVWALLIVLLTALGFATALVGFIVIYPVLGHASWHAYRALQRRAETARNRSGDRSYG
jgi:uncharacterized membrane protein